VPLLQQRGLPEQVWSVQPRHEEAQGGPQDQESVAEAGEKPARELRRDTVPHQETKTTMSMRILRIASITRVR
jgi:hypothetical protein